MVGHMTDSQVTMVGTALKVTMRYLHFPVGVTRPPKGYRSVEWTCGVCGATLPITVASITLARRRRIWRGLGGLVLTLCALSVLIATTAVANTSAAVADWLDTVPVWVMFPSCMFLVISAITGAALLVLAWHDDGVRIPRGTPRRATHPVHSAKQVERMRRKARRLAHRSGQTKTKSNTP